MQEMWVRSLGGEEPLEKKIATHSSILAWEIPWTEEPGGLQSWNRKRVGHTSVAPQQQQPEKVQIQLLSLMPKNFSKAIVPASSPTHGARKF